MMFNDAAERGRALWLVGGHKGGGANRRFQLFYKPLKWSRLSRRSHDSLCTNCEFFRTKKLWNFTDLLYFHSHRCMMGNSAGCVILIPFKKTVVSLKVLYVWDFSSFPFSFNVCWTCLSSGLLVTWPHRHKEAIKISASFKIKARENNSAVSSDLWPFLLRAAWILRLLFSLCRTEIVDVQREEGK